MRRARTVRTEAIVLRHRNIGEADRILTLLTPEHGKLNAIAKGVRRPTSRKAGHLDLYMRTDLLLAKGRDLDIVTQAELLDAYQPIREDLLRASYATYCIELLDQFTPEGESHPALYELLSQALGWLGTAAALPLTTRYYELHLLRLAGYQPELQRCAINGEPIEPQDQYFDALAGGVVCPACAGVRRSAQSITMAALKVLRFLHRSPYEALRDLRLRAATESELERVLAHYITVQLERQLKSVDFLNRVRRASRAQER